MDDHLTFAALRLEAAPDELPTGPLLSGGSSDPVLVPFLGAALLAHGIETDWSRGQNADAVTGSMTSGLARWREMSGVHEPPSLSTAGTQADADHYIGAETWRELIASARGKLDEAGGSDEPANAPAPTPAFTPPPGEDRPSTTAPTVDESPRQPAPQGDPAAPVTPGAADANEGAPASPADVSAA